MSRNFIVATSIFTGLCSSAALVSYSTDHPFMSAFFLFWAVTVGLLVGANPYD